MHVPQYRETLFSQVYPGKQDSGPTYIPILAALNTRFGFTSAQKACIALRSDAGFGSDGNVNQALESSWHVLAKGKGGRRPTAYARQIPQDAWQLIGHNRWVAEAVDPVLYIRPTQHFVLRWLTESQGMKYSTVVSSLLQYSAAETIALYDRRGQCETEIQADKGGLKLERRRKKRLMAQEALVLLTDVAHNLLTWTRDWMFPAPSPLVSLGTTRLIDDVLCLPGHLEFHNDRLVEIQLNQRHPYAAQVAVGLARLLDHFHMT